MDKQRIGLIADSHGNLEATAEAIRLLKGRGAGLIVHLGDFCDSVRRDGAAAMISLLEDHGVLAVKGNNDFLVENMLSDGRRPKTPEGERVVAFLRSVPVVRAVEGIRFAHSLPFDSLRSLYTPIDMGDTRRAREVFAETDFQILFCGHSHLPILFREAGGRVTRETMAAGGKITLVSDGVVHGKEERFIVVVGAAEDGECALYDRAAGAYERLRIFT